MSELCLVGLREQASRPSFEQPLQALLICISYEYSVCEGRRAIPPPIDSLNLIGAFASVACFTLNDPFSPLAGRLAAKIREVEAHLLCQPAIKALNTMRRFSEEP